MSNRDGKHQFNEFRIGKNANNAPKANMKVLNAVIEMDTVTTLFAKHAISLTFNLDNDSIA